MSEPIITVPLDSWNKALDLIDALRKRNEKLEAVAEAARKQREWKNFPKYEQALFDALSALDKEDA